MSKEGQLEARQKEYPNTRHLLVKNCQKWVERKVSRAATVFTNASVALICTGLQPGRRINYSQLNGRKEINTKWGNP